MEFNEIPPQLIFNWDQSGINLVPSALWTMNKKGEKRVAIASHLDKRQITAVMCGNLVGELLPMQLIYVGKPKDVIQLINSLKIGLYPILTTIGQMRILC